MRASEFITEDEKLDEVLPLIGLAARAAVGGAAKMAGRAALKGVGALAKGAARAVGKTAGAAMGALGSDDEDDQETPTANDPNAKVGTQQQPPRPQPSAGSNKPVNPTAQTGANDFRPGAKINLPTTSGRVGNFKVTKVTGDEVEIENPDKFKLTGEPDKLTFTRDELASLMGNKK